MNKGHEPVEQEPTFVGTRAEAERQLEHLKWFRWPGHVVRALQGVEECELDLAVEPARPEQHKRLQAITEFGGYLRANGAGIPNSGERYRCRCGQTISSALVEATVNQVISKRKVKQHQMQ